MTGTTPHHAPPPLALAPAMADALARWLDGERSTRDRSDHTITAYQSDLLAFLSFLGGHHGAPALPARMGALTQSDMRAFAAAERTRGLSARSLARRLSAVRSFLRWLADREGFDVSRALSSRAPRYRRSLPRPLAPDQARAVLDLAAVTHDTPWVAARDQAVLTLLYGCGLRISEALALDGRDWPMGEVLRVRGKGGKERQVPVLPVLNLTMVWNPGVTFGLFAGSGAVGRWALSAVAFLIIGALLAWIWRTRSAVTAAAAGLIAGGAIGNLVDRLRFGAVTDFIDLHWGAAHWPTFNLADAAIVCGVALLLLTVRGSDSRAASSTLGRAAR